MAWYLGVCATVLLVFVAYDGVFVDAACPSTQAEAEMQTKTCLRSIGMDIESGGGMGNDVDQMKQYCKDGTLESALGCVEEIINDCKARDDALGDALDNMISVSQLRSGFKYLCDNLNVLVDNGQCIASQQNGILACVQRESKRLQGEMKKMQAEGSQPTKEDIYRLSCGFMDRMFGCQHDLYKDNCNQEVADVMTTFMQSAKPPFCADYSGASTLSISWTLLACLFGLYMYLRE